MGEWTMTDWIASIPCPTCKAEFMGIYQVSATFNGVSKLDLTDLDRAIWIVEYRCGICKDKVWMKLGL